MRESRSDVARGVQELSRLIFAVIAQDLVRYWKGRRVVFVVVAPVEAQHLMEGNTLALLLSHAETQLYSALHAYVPPLSTTVNLPLQQTSTASECHRYQDTAATPLTNITHHHTTTRLSAQPCKNSGKESAKPRSRP